MKFEHVYPDAKTDEIFLSEFYVRKDSKLQECASCGSMTRWFDLTFIDFSCSQECCSYVMESFKKGDITFGNNDYDFDFWRHGLPLRGSRLRGHKNNNNNKNNDYDFDFGRHAFKRASRNKPETRAS